MGVRLIRPVLIRSAGVILCSGLLAVRALAGPAGPELVRTGRRVYQQFCLYCHGPNMVNVGTRAFDLRRFPPDQRERFDTAVMKGKGQMPAWGDVLKEDDLNALWAYVKTGAKR